MAATTPIPTLEPTPNNHTLGSMRTNLVQKKANPNGHAPSALPIEPPLLRVLRTNYGLKLVWGGARLPLFPRSCECRCPSPSPGISAILDWFSFQCRRMAGEGVPHACIHCAVVLTMTRPHWSASRGNTKQASARRNTRCYKPVSCSCGKVPPVCKQKRPETKS